MKKLFNASFEQSLNIKDDSLVQYMIQDTEKRGIYNGKKRWVLLIIAIVFIFVQYGFVIVTEVGIQNPDQDSFVEQANINMLPRSVFCLLFLIYLFIWLYTKKYNNDSIKIFITMNTVNNYLIWLLIEANLFFITFFLKPLTVVGTTLLFGSIGLIGYAVFRSKKRSLENVLYETEGKKDKLDEWLEKVIKVVMRYGWIVVIVVMGWKILFPSEGVRTDIVGFIGIVGMWTAINIGFIVAEVYLFFPYLLYGYYKYKYPEEYREWEGKSQIEWYGEKYYNKHIKGTEREKKMTNKKEEKLLPIGSIVLLEEGLQKLMIVGRGTIYTDQQTGKDTFADYMAVLYPTGLNPETTIFFNHKDIDKVVFRGYSDDEEER